MHLQRDVGLMQINVDVLDQYALSLQKEASRIIDRCLGPCEYPAAEIATGALGGGGGGSVAFEGFVLLPAGIVLCNLMLLYLLG